MNFIEFFVKLKSEFHSVEISKFFSQYIWQKFREITRFTYKSYCKMISRNIFQVMRVKFLFFHTVDIFFVKFNRKYLSWNHNMQQSFAIREFLHFSQKKSFNDKLCFAHTKVSALSHSVEFLEIFCHSIFYVKSI